MVGAGQRHGHNISTDAVTTGHLEHSIVRVRSTMAFSSKITQYFKCSCSLIMPTREIILEISDTGSV